MDIQSAAAQLMQALGSNPNMVSQFAAHPYSTTAKVTGTDERISQKDMSRIITQVAAQANGQQLGTSDTKDLASALMSQSGGSVHSLASALFGGAGAGAGSSASTAAGAQAKAGSGFDLSSVLGALGAGAGSSSASSSAGPSMAEIAAKSIAGGLAARGMAALITGAMGAAKNNAANK